MMPLLQYTENILLSHVYNSRFPETWKANTTAVLCVLWQWTLLLSISPA